MPVVYNEDGVSEVFVCSQEMSVAEVAWWGCEPNNPVPKGLIGLCPMFDTEEHARAWDSELDILTRVKYEPEGE